MFGTEQSQYCFLQPIFSVAVNLERMDISVNIVVLKTRPTRVRQPQNIVPRRKPSYVGRGNFRNPAPTYIQRENNRDQSRNLDLCFVAGQARGFF